MGAGSVACHRETDVIWLRFPAAEYSEVSVPHWVLDFFSTPPESAGLVGGEDGYCILQWPADFPLQRLTPPGAELGEHTGRALIATCAASEPIINGTLINGTVIDGCKADIHFRYFAPQYGVLEDAATGSAMRVLVGYWRDAFRGKVMTAYQCSPDGGWLSGRAHGSDVWVGGTVAVDRASRVNG